MFKDLWGEVKGGRLQRLPYFYYSLMLFFFLILTGAVFSSLEVEEGMLGDAQPAFSGNLTMPLILAGALVLYGITSMNIMAKRFRDTGLPGWWSTLGVAVIGPLLSQFVSAPVGIGFNLLAMLALFFMPSASFNKQQQMGSG